MRRWEYLQERLASGDATGEQTCVAANQSLRLCAYCCSVDAYRPLMTVKRTGPARPGKLPISGRISTPGSPRLESQFRAQRPRVIGSGAVAKWLLEPVEVSGKFLAGVRLELPLGLTFVIRPRGSEKSTLAEAVRYALGGQPSGRPRTDPT